MARVIRLLLPTAFLAAALSGQTFDVASVKPGSDPISTRPERSGGRFHWTTQICYLVGYAYGLDFSRVSGPRCGAIYAIDATFDPSASDDSLRSMLQSLLRERFKLRSHRVSTEAEGFALVIGKGRPKLKDAKAGDDSYVAVTGPDRGVLTVTGRRATIADLAAALGRSAGKPIWDRTGVAGVESLVIDSIEEPSAN